MSQLCIDLSPNTGYAPGGQNSLGFTERMVGASKKVVPIDVGPIRVVRDGPNRLERRNLQLVPTPPQVAHDHSPDLIESH